MDPQRAKLERDALIAPYIETLTRAKNAAPESEDANRLQVIIHAIEMVELETLDRAEHVVNWHLHELEGHLARMATLDNR